VAVPDLLRIPCETGEYARFDLVGRDENGQQFVAFVTGALPVDEIAERLPEPLRRYWRSEKRWYAVLHRFDADGNHLGTDARSGGADGESDATNRAEQELDALLAALGPWQSGDIWVRLFEVERDGCLFGLVYERSDEEDPELEYVLLEPNDIMFHPPWDSGDYST
jgi:hypothetical protein